MEREIKGRFVNGKIELLEEADLEDGQEVKVIVPLRRKKEWNQKSFMATSGAWKDDAEYWDEFLQILYKDGRRRNLLEDN